MKSFIIITTLLLSFVSIASAPKMIPQEVEIKTYDFYIPKGFDSNDASELVVSGVLPSHCYQSPKVEVKGTKGSEISVTVKALYLPYEKCLQVIIPFTLTVQLGVLDSGEYKIISNNEKEGKMHIDLARTIGMDDSIYANVEYIEESDYGRTITLVGTNPSDCFELDRIDYTTNGNNTISVLPILKVKSDVCLPVESDFEYQFEVPADLPAKIILIHVRKMNGKSVNKVYKNYHK